MQGDAPAAAEEASAEEASAAAPPEQPEEFDNPDVYITSNVTQILEDFRKGEITYNGNKPNLDYVDTDLHVRGKDGKWLRVPRDCVLLSGAPLPNLPDERFAELCNSAKSRKLVPFDNKDFNVVTILKIEGLVHAPYNTPGAFISLEQDPRLLFKLDQTDVQAFTSCMYKSLKKAKTSNEKFYPTIVCSYLRDNVPPVLAEKDKKEMIHEGTIKMHTKFQQIVEQLYSQHPDAYAERAGYRFTTQNAMKTDWTVVGKYDVEKREFMSKGPRRRSAGAAADEPAQAAKPAASAASAGSEAREKSAAQEDSSESTPVPAAQKNKEASKKRGRKQPASTPAPAPTPTPAPAAAGPSGSAPEVRSPPEARSLSAIQVDLSQGGVLDVLLPGKRMCFTAVTSGDFSWVLKDLGLEGGR